ncbi:hypothetical protein [Chamaesiphon sp. OTE_75_metabat_556]|uniref:hypothetical protein n=1 Tax=Chamaesiphon sp. OTE_75_metabat_556 TaxID=2964692 RepID=UPI00286D433F|nr:hypothetical protein [Chamaesiphon sp. OTE_75_metabat_556]
MISHFYKAQAERKCPKCGSSSLTRSQRVDLTERMLALVDIYPYRCHKQTCKHRFESFGRN